MGEPLKKGDLLATGGVVWEVIATNDESSLLITKDIIARLPYYQNRDESCRGYVDSTIRRWLNGDFLSSLPYEFTKRLVKTKLMSTEKSTDSIMQSTALMRTTLLKTGCFFSPIRRLACSSGMMRLEEHTSTSIICGAPNQKPMLL